MKEVYVAEVNLSLLEGLLPEQAVFQEISKFPAASRDIALLVQEDVQHQAILDVLSSLKLKHLQAIRLFDVYQGVPVSYNLTFQNADATLEDEEIVRYMEKIQKALESELGAEIR